MTRSLRRNKFICMDCTCPTYSWVCLPFQRRIHVTAGHVRSREGALPWNPTVTHRAGWGEGPPTKINDSQRDLDHKTPASTQTWLFTRGDTRKGLAKYTDWSFERNSLPPRFSMCPQAETVSLKRGCATNPSSVDTARNENVFLAKPKQLSRKYYFWSFTFHVNSLCFDRLPQC